MMNILIFQRKYNELSSSKVTFGQLSDFLLVIDSDF